MEGRTESESKPGQTPQAVGGQGADNAQNRPPGKVGLECPLWGLWGLCALWASNPLLGLFKGLEEDPIQGFSSEMLGVAGGHTNGSWQTRAPHCPSEYKTPMASRSRWPVLSLTCRILVLRSGEESGRVRTEDPQINMQTEQGQAFGGTQPVAPASLAPTPKLPAPLALSLGTEGLQSLCGPLP